MPTTVVESAIQASQALIPNSNLIYSAVGQNIPQQQHADFWDAADISSSYALIDARICEEVISGGNSADAACCKSNSFCSKRIASPTASGPLVFRFLARGMCSCSDIEFKNGLYCGIEDHCKSGTCVGNGGLTVGAEVDCSQVGIPVQPVRP